MAKRKELTEHDKYVHKSRVRLQREAKKVRTFLVRKVVQQLKQVREKQPKDDAEEKVVAKWNTQVAKYEHEHHVLKTLSLERIVDCACKQAGLKADDRDDDAAFLESDDDAEEELSAKSAGIAGGAEPSESKPAKDDEKLTKEFVDRVLKHKQMLPLVAAIKQYVETRAKEKAKKQRQRDKKADKRGRAQLVGGRSAAPPTSLFFGSLSGLGDDRRDDNDEEDDIAEFLGETRSGKNRPGQRARRAKALREEEAKQRSRDPNGKKRLREQQGSEYPRKKTPFKTREPVDSSERSERPQYREPQEQAPRQHREPRQEPSAPKPPAIDISHPSWIAKQAQKEKQKMALQGFSGKKITFDD